jgi:hypothetical protein
MLRFAALSLSIVLVSLPLTTPSFAQRAAPRQTAVPTDLARWCYQMVIRKYARPAREYQPRRMVSMPSDQAISMQNACISSKGRII